MWFDVVCIASCCSWQQLPACSSHDPSPPSRAIFRWKSPVEMEVYSWEHIGTSSINERFSVAMNDCKRIFFLVSTYR